MSRGTGGVDADSEELTDDALTRDYRVWQRRRGHRYSLDDVVTAWEAVRDCPGARRVLDLGCGLGSALLMVAWKQPEAHLVGVEAQAVSFALAQRNVARNELFDRVTLVHGDLRDPAVLTPFAATPFDLITGTPPYMPAGQGVRSPDAQRAHARMELRGGIEDYLSAAGRVLGPGGRVVACADARKPGRVLDGAAHAGLAPVRRRDVIPRAGHKGALFAVWTLARAEERAEPYEHAETFVARDERGARTEPYRQVRRFFGLPGAEKERPSP